MAQLSMLASEITETVDWGERALASARRIGDREVEIHALNNIGSALTSSDDVSEGRHYLIKSLDLALAANAHEHVGRAYTNLGYDGVINRQFSDAERYLRAVSRTARTGISTHGVTTWVRGSPCCWPSEAGTTRLWRRRR
jgi:hypothetical protein